MDKKIKDRWVKALRSGRYTKCRQSLCEDGRFCALGVLCELYRLSAEGKRNGTRWGQEDIFINGQQYPLCEKLPEPVIRWADLDEEDPILTKTDRTVVDVNDGIEDEDYRPRSFSYIADLIERNL